MDFYTFVIYRPHMYVFSRLNILFISVNFLRSSET